MSEHQVVIIGAGSGGVASAVALKDAGMRPVLLDEADEVGVAWRERYDRLRLNSSKTLSKLPKRPWGKGTSMFPSRLDVAEYLDTHAREDGIDLRLGTSVSKIDQADGGWVVHSSQGDLEADNVIVATGNEREPFIPHWPGREKFTGELIHSAQYKNFQPYVGKDVLVVGPGCSGMEIAHDIADNGGNDVWLAVRTPPNMVLRIGPAGMPGDYIANVLMKAPVGFADRFANFGRKMDMGDLTEFGLPVPEEGVFARNKRLGVAPAIIDKEVVESIKARKFTIVAAVDSLDETGVDMGDGTRLEPDAIIASTGYRRGLEPLVGHLGVLDHEGRPVARHGEPARPGLWFVGFVPRPGQIGYMSKEAAKAARAISSARR